MEKVKAWIIVGFSSFFILLFGLTIIVLIPDLFKAEIVGKDSYIAIFAMLVFTVLLIFLLKYGIKKLKINKPQKITDYNRELDINFNSRIEFKDYRNLILELSFKLPVLLFYAGIFFIIVFNLITISDNISISIMIPVLIGLLLTPILIIYQTKRIYSTNKFFHEQVSYSLTNTSIKIKGESFDSEVKWTHYYKIKETKDFFILYQGNTIGNLLQKKSMKADDINEFRLFTKSLNLFKDLRS
jgi:hypothetical protein